MTLALDKVGFEVKVKAEVVLPWMTGLSAAAAGSASWHSSNADLRDKMSIHLMTVYTAAVVF